MRSALMQLLVAVLLLALLGPATGHGTLAPLLGMDNLDKFPDEYMVVFHPGYTLQEHFHNIGHNFSSEPEFRASLFGYKAILDDKTRDEQVRRDPGVKFMEVNRPVYGIRPDKVAILDQPLETQQKPRVSKRMYTKPDVIKGAPYGLQMLTTPSMRLLTPVEDEGNYSVVPNAGLGVNVYILDGGIRITHDRFQGRARNFGGLAPSDMSPYVNVTMDDVTCHGTNVAGIVGAEQYGVAPHANLINVKVLNNAHAVGSWRGDHAGVTSAIYDIVAEHNANVEKALTDPNPWNFRGSIINMSFAWATGGEAISGALALAHELGISVFACAGNEHEDTDDWYPCAIDSVNCIAAVDASYNKWKRSNWGNTINFVAPGHNVQSTDCKNDYQLVMMSGTSQATPHAAGAAAIFASWKNLVGPFDTATDYMYHNARDYLVTGFQAGTSTLLVNTGIFSTNKGPNEPFVGAGTIPVYPWTGSSLNAQNTTNLTNGIVQPGSPPTPADDPWNVVGSTIEPAPGQVTLPGVYDGDGPMTALPPAPIPTPDTDPLTPYCANSGTPFPQPPAQDLIRDFCSSDPVSQLFIPYIGYGNGFSETGTVKTVATDYSGPLDGTTQVLWFRLAYTLDGCTDGPFIGSDECGTRFSTILNGCGTNTITSKLGGSLSVGCAEYTLWAQDEDTTPIIYDPLPGSFECQDTVEPLAELYPDSCMCWMSERMEQAAAFAKPANGICDGSNVDGPNGLLPGQGY